MNTRNQIYFAGWIVWGIIAAMAWAFYSIPQNNEITLQQYENVKQNVFNETQIAEYDLSQVAKLIDTNFFEPFVKVNLKTKYPFFIFQDKKLSFWSDYSIVPLYQDLQGNYRFKLLNYKNSVFIALKSKIEAGKNKIELYSLIPVFIRYKIENQYLKPQYNATLIPFDNIKVVQSSVEQNFKIIAPSGEFLFSLNPVNTLPKINYFLWYAFVISASLCLLFVGLYVQYRFIMHISKASYLGYNYIFWLIFLGILYGIVFYLKLFPAYLYWLGATLWVLILVVYLLSFYRNFKLTRAILRANQVLKYIVATFFVVGIYFIAHLYFFTLNYIFISQAVSLDFTKNIDFNSPRLLYIFIFIAISFVFVFAIHILFRLVIQLFDKYLSFLYALLIAILIYGLFVFWQQNLVYLPTTFVLTLYVLLVYFWFLPKYLFSFKYLSTIYFFISSILCAFIGSLSVFYTEEVRQIADKRKFAIQLLSETDALAESQLKEVVTQIKKDTIIPMFMRDTNTNQSIIENRIKLEYLQRYFDNYQVSLAIFDKKGKSIETPQDSMNTYPIYQKKYAKIYYQTEVEGVYFIDNLTGNLIKQYVIFIEVVKNKTIMGYLVIDLTQKKSIPNNVYPTLLVDKRFVQSPELRYYSYAVYSKNKLNYSFGDCNYETQFNNRLFNKALLFEKGISLGNFNHFALEGGGKRIVVSSPYYSYNATFTNFSFLFLILVFAVALTLLVDATMHRFRGLKVNFATRIQFYLNLAFFLPLIVVSIVTLSVISSSYQKDFEDQFVQKTESVANNIVWYYENFKNNTLSKDKFTEIFTQLAQYVEVDMNIFDEKGRLVISNQPTIYENDGLLSKYINPWAYKAILIEKKKNSMFSELVGSLNFKSVYVPIKSYQKGTIEGILSIPFFDSKFQLETKKREALAIIVNIFTAIFLVFLVISYFASRILTIPLRLITQRIRKTTFSDYNQPLEWKSKDEIGLFVEEFNKMLKKLDASKDALARSQMENAWREIAKQVAHEIKNPLTPIKLTIQHMQMRLQNQPEKIQTMFERAFETLLTQVEVLDDIATSFSSFAKMPIPESQRFEVANVLTEIQNLYLNNENIELNAAIQKGNFFVIGDKKLMTRIFTNLIKNAIEAIPEDRTPQIELFLESDSKKIVTISIKDNGMGIPNDLQEKIFLPNFTTKSTGSGIGLAVAKRGVEHAGGRIWFETEEAIGTTFFIELPLVD